MVKSTGKSLPGSSKSNPKSVKGSIRLNKYIANAGICSRREADQLIQQGKIKVNGKIVTTLGYQVKSGDRVKYLNKVLSAEKLVYVLLNKPKDFITTTQDPQGRKTVMQLVSKACKERIVPVGRLDRNTTGLLLFTNDGDLTKKLSHPSHEVKKIYHVQLDTPVQNAHLDGLQQGVELDDGPVMVDAVEIVSADKKQLGIEIHSGRNRVIRRLFEQLGYDVVKLDRVMFAGLTKKDLPRGKWRHLNKQEVIRLKHLTGGTFKRRTKKKPLK